ncbi:MAG TPA: hypothetical protein PLF13_02495 [candidate division Zixibacteria bacterium]|nr:hypothetical protein [candidate division Zixibacteria bacterium]
MKLTITALMLALLTLLFVGCGSTDKEEAGANKTADQNTAQSGFDSPQMRKIYLQTMEAAIEEWGGRYETLKQQITELPEPTRKTLEEPVAQVGKAIDALKENYDRLANSGDADFAEAKADLEKALRKVQEDFNKATSMANH